MKKGAVILSLVLLSIFLITPVSALEIKADSDYDKGATFIASLQGNILSPIPDNNVAFYQDHVQVPFTHGFLKIKDIYYVYAILPYIEGNYSLRIKDVYFKEQNTVKTLTLEKNFTISNKTAEFNVNPGAVIATDSFEISVYNNLDNSIHSLSVPLTLSWVHASIPI